MGRGAAANGNGRAVLSQGALSSMTRYEQPRPRRQGLRLVGRILLWVVGVLTMVAASLGGGVYLFFHESVKAVVARSPEAQIAARQLNIALPNQPAVALVIGHDKRFGERGPSRSDTVMMLRVDPETEAVSMLSFPRDLDVPILCQPGVVRFQGKINAAFSECGVSGTLNTVRALTNVPINYLITVNFRAFKQVVNTLGGVWIDVDRRYFNDNSGLGAGFRYATIDIRPGYQRLNGSNALDFVRYRHGDNDLYRSARQQLFVKAVKEQLSDSVGAFDLPRIVGAVTQNVQIVKGGNKVLSGTEVLEYAVLAYKLPPGHFFQSRIGGLTESFQAEYKLSTDPANIQDAVRDFVSPDVEAPEKAAAVALGRKLPARRAPRPREVSVVVLNGNGVEGAAASASYLLSERGYQTLSPPGNAPANAPPPRTRYFRTEIYYDPARAKGKLAAQGLANLFGSAHVTRGIPPGHLRRLAGGAMTLIVVGQTFHNTLAPAPIDKTPPRRPANVRKDPKESAALLRSVRRRLDFRLMVPTIVERGSNLDTDQPLRIYKINKEHKALRLVFRLNATEYWGIQQTDWDGAPVLSDKSFTHRLKDGRTYDFYYSGPQLHMVVLRYRGATYWVVNTLVDTLSNETMIAIAKGLKPLPAK